MKKILVIDDSALMRRLVSDIISLEPDMVVTDTAENGAVAVQYLESGKVFDCILLDITMPQMDGIGFLRSVRMKNISMPPVLVVSSIASKSAKETIRALELGAFDFVKKPEKYRDGELSVFKDNLLEKIRCGLEIRPVLPVRKKDRSEETKKLEKPELVKQAPIRMTRSVRNDYAGVNSRLIFIASSTGGPRALQSVIPRFPKDIGCPIVVVQHMPENFTASLAERLNEMSECEVKEAVDGEVLRNGVVYVAKGGCQLRVEMKNRSEHVLAVRKEPARGGLRPCADVFLESLLDSGYSDIYCAVLTGMGSDGTQGLIQLKRVKQVYTVGQNKESCVVYGMPRVAAKEGVVDEVADLRRVADTLIAAMQQNGG